MPSLLSKAPISDQQRQANDRHRHGVVLAVLAMLALYLYLFTYIADPFGVPRPQPLAEQFGVPLPYAFDADGNVDSMIGITLTQRYQTNDAERLVFLLVLIAAFLCAYYLPLRYKQPALAFWAALAIHFLYGSQALAGLLLAHLGVYLTLHPRRRGYVALCAAGGLAAYWAFVHTPGGAVDGWWLAGLTLGAVLWYRAVLLPLLGVARLAPPLRTLVVQSAILTVCISAFIEGAFRSEWSLPLGLLLFFWQWERLMMYHIDYKDGEVPSDVSLGRYLAVFLNPGVVPNWSWGATIAQGYSYVHNNFLCEDKNALVIAGLKLWAVALFYLLFWDWIVHVLTDFFTAQGIPVFRAYTKDLVAAFTQGVEVSTASVLLTTLLDLTRWTMMWIAVTHFKVGIWNVCGYRVDPYIQRPWAATNLATLWSRFTFHYRAFLVRAFYYPVFTRFFKRRRHLRVLIATLAAASFGNMVWGHVPERLYYRGMAFEHLAYVLGLWPYFLLLGAGIAAAHLYLLQRKSRRKPWTLDRWLITDVLAAYCTLQYFALVHIFARPAPESTLADLTRLFLKGFGIDIGT